MKPSLLVMVLSLICGVHSTNALAQCRQDDPLCGVELDSSGNPVESGVDPELSNANQRGRRRAAGRPAQARSQRPASTPQRTRTSAVPTSPQNPGSTDGARETTRGGISHIDFDSDLVNGQRRNPGEAVLVRRSMESSFCGTEYTTVRTLRARDVSSLNVREQEAHMANVEQAHATLIRCYEGVSEFANAAEEAVGSTPTCPTTLTDLEPLTRLIDLYNRDPQPVDQSDLITYPIDASLPISALDEMHLPYSCGYNSTQERWFPKSNNFCVSEGLCYAGGEHSYSKMDFGFTPLRREVNLWKMTRPLNGDRSWRDEGTVGDQRLIPLAEGIYLLTYSGLRNRIFYKGLVFVPSARRILRKACRQMQAATELLEAGHVSLAGYNAGLVEIHGEVQKARLLKDLKELTTVMNAHRYDLFAASIYNEMKARALELNALIKNKWGRARTLTEQDRQDPCVLLQQQ